MSEDKKKLNENELDKVNGGMKTADKAKISKDYLTNGCDITHNCDGTDCMVYPVCTKGWKN